MSSGELDESFTKKNEYRDLYKEMPWLAVTNNFYKKSAAHESSDESDDDDDGQFAAHRQFLQNPASDYQFGGGNYARPESEKFLTSKVATKQRPLIVEEDDADSDSAAARQPAGEAIAESSGAPTYTRPPGVGETVNEPGGRSWKRDEIWKQVKAANAGQNLGKAPAKGKRGFGDHLKSFGKGLASFGGWLAGGLFTGGATAWQKIAGWKEGRNTRQHQRDLASAQANGASPLALKGIQDKIVKSMYTRAGHQMEATKWGRHASGYQWRKRLGWLTKGEQSEIQQASGFGDSDIKATWRDARDQVQNRVPVEERANSITSGEIGDDPNSAPPVDDEQLMDQREELQQYRPTTIADQRQKMRQSRLLDKKIRDSRRSSGKAEMFARLNFDDLEKQPKMDAIPEQDEDDELGSV
jgi:hypothetical protein